MIAPVVLFTYNKLNTLQMTINSLLTNEESSKSTLIIFSDGPKDILDEKRVNNVRNYIQTIEGFEIRGRKEKITLHKVDL